MAWRADLTDLNANPIAALKLASARGVRLPLNRLATSRFQTRRDNPDLLDIMAGETTLLKVYERPDPITGVGEALRFFGPLTSIEKVAGAEGDSVAVGATSVGWRLGKRLIGKSKQGVTYGTPLAMINRSTIATSVLADANASGWTGIEAGSIVPCSPSYAGPWYYKNALEALTELGAPLDGFDWRITPQEPSEATQAAPPAKNANEARARANTQLASPGQAIAQLDIAPFFGTVRPDAVWEYGFGRRNVAGFRHIIDPTTLLNRGYILPPGFPDNATQNVLSAQDDVSIAGRLLYEDVVNADLTPDDLRQKLVQEHVNIRRQPRQIITITASREDGRGRVPKYGLDYTEGDIVPFRAREYGQTTVDALFRIYTVDMGIDEAGAATPTLSLVEEDA